MEWNWWEQPYVRLPKFIGFSFSVTEPPMEMVTVREILFRREPWVVPPIYNPRTGEVEKLTHVYGVPGTRQHGLSWVFPAWRCQSCKTVFIVGDFDGLRHGCTE